MKILKVNIPSHIYGRSFKQDFVLNGIDGYVIGAYAHLRNVSAHRPDRNNVIGKVAISTDNGEIVHPSLPVMFTPTKGTINKMLSPIDYKLAGNKLTIVVEENTNIEEYKDQRIGYDLEIYLKTAKRAANVTDLNRNRKAKTC